MAGAVPLFTAEVASAQQCTASDGSLTSDFVTGGGWILPDGMVKANFGVAGGCKNGSFFGHLEYVDHGSANATGFPTPFRVHGKSVTGYFFSGPTTRDITGMAETSDKQMVTYCVRVTDNGEGQSFPADLFGIQLSNGYNTGLVPLPLGGGGPGGGNIQLHKGNPPPPGACFVGFPK